MINGEKACEPSSEALSLHPPKEIHASSQFQNSDDGDESPTHSHYSSFGDSEFEQYCSANSAMGTPSLCSSVGTFQESGELDFGRGSVLGEISNSLESFRLEGEFSRNFRERRLSSSSESVGFSGQINEECEGKNNFYATYDVVGRDLMGANDGFVLCNQLKSENSNAVLSRCRSEPELPAVAGLDIIMDEELCISDDGGGIVRHDDHVDLTQTLLGAAAVQQTIGMNTIETNIAVLESDVQKVESCLPELHSHSDADLEREEREECSNEERDSSRYDHSEGEDSMFGYGTDDDQKLEFFNQKNIQLYQEAKGGKGNDLLMSSSVAFGSDDWDDFDHDTRQLDINSILWEKRQPSVENEKEVLGSPSHTSAALLVGRSERGEYEIDVSLSSDQVQDAVELLNCSENTSLTPSGFVDIVEKENSRDAADAAVANDDTGIIDELAYCLENQSGSDISYIEENPLSQRSHFKEDLNMVKDNIRETPQVISNEGFTNVDGNRVLVVNESDSSDLQLDPPIDVTASQFHAVSTKIIEDPRLDVAEACSPVTTDKNHMERSLGLPASFELFQRHQKPDKIDNVELDDFCNELVHEMEEILLDSTESSLARFNCSDSPNQGHSDIPLRDGGFTASTTGTADANPLNQQTYRIDGIEVIGAKQKKGDVSFSERLVGVKEYTVYVIQVWSENDHWEVERRYRDFCTLHRRLKSSFTAQGWILPSPWSSVERESRKIFGNVSPDVVRERSALIQDCLRSILSHQFPSSLTSALIWFLSPQKNIPSSPSSGRKGPQSPFSGSATHTDGNLVFGKTISLVVEIRPYKSIKQILEAQHFTCAGCHKHFDDGKTRVLEFVQTLGWSKPRLCEYTGQLFCPTCHINELAVLPARVLHHWDFTQYPVSQMAKSYLDSIQDKPMLCVSAVNPFLFSKVPALQQVTGVRKRIGVMLPYVRCPFRMSISKGLASRRYLLESNDFFALRDLIDLSKGAFAALPVMVDTISRKILEHITEQCLVCCDVGVPCNARQACTDPSALIFPFQEVETERCRSCKSVFHKHCFRKIRTCPCGESLELNGEKGRLGDRVTSTLDLFGRKSGSNSTMGFLSGLFAKGNYENFWGPKDDDTVISMGSLPSTSL